MPKKRITDKYPSVEVSYKENEISPERTPFDKADTERKDIEPKQFCIFDESTPSNIEDVPFVRKEKTASRKELFENAYKKYYYQSLKQRKESIIKELIPYFKMEEETAEFVNSNLLRKKRNAYLMKYIEKSGEKIVYSKGLPQYFISDIMDEDIVCAIGADENKLLLFDDFTCWDNGREIGTVNKETISKLRKSNQICLVYEFCLKRKSIIKFS